MAWIYWPSLFDLVYLFLATQDIQINAVKILFSIICKLFYYTFLAYFSLQPTSEL